MCSTRRPPVHSRCGQRPALPGAPAALRVVWPGLLGPFWLNLRGDDHSCSLASMSATEGWVLSRYQGWRENRIEEIRAADRLGDANRRPAASPANSGWARTLTGVRPRGGVSASSPPVQ